jgi:site-specific recombinase XerD
MPPPFWVGGTGRLRRRTSADRLPARPRPRQTFLGILHSQHSQSEDAQGVLRGGLAVSAWCENKKFRLEDIQPIRVAGYVEQLMQTHSKPTIKQHLAAIRMLFDWLVTGQVIPLNRAHSVRRPRHSVKKGKTSLLSAEEMRPLLDSIETSKLIGLRDRALIALMGYTFARVGAAVQMKVEDY